MISRFGFVHGWPEPAAIAAVTKPAQSACQAKFEQLVFEVILRGRGGVPGSAHSRSEEMRICFQTDTSSMSTNSLRRPQGPNSAWHAPMT